ncbi:flavin reductase family protein [Streptomyces sp. NPDC048430]|uniref:flavin reductase family protein n=1 Tax=Streptomyces sp. NPDC048430 TaxID=3155388 RepID=UPI003434E818
MPVASPAADPALFRSVVGSFCSGLTVIAATGPQGPLGMTCQSFISLSLDPPLVLFSPAKTSTTWPRIREIGSFCINLLAEDHDQISAQMARSGTDKFAGVTYDLSPLGAPRLAGVTAWLDCILHTEHDGGDHTIVVANVRDLAATHDTQPLLFHRGRYARLSSSTTAERR